MHDDTYHGTAHHGQAHGHDAFEDAESHATRFDAPERDAWQKPDAVLDACALAEDSTVVEIGAGTGYFTVRLAKRVKDGKVIAIDASPKMTAYLQKRVDDLGLPNVEVRHASQGEMPLRETADVIMCVDSYHHIAERVAFFALLKAHLNRDGAIVIIDRAEHAPVGPPAAHRTPPELIKKEMAQAGFALVREMDFLLPYQHFLAFKTADDGKENA